MRLTDIAVSMCDDRPLLLVLNPLQMPKETFLAQTPANHPPDTISIFKSMSMESFKARSRKSFTLTLGPHWRVYHQSHQ